MEQWNQEQVLMSKPLFLHDDDGEKVSAGDRVRFNYGIPLVPVVGKVIQRKHQLIILTPGHLPKESNLRSLRRHVGAWFKEKKP